MFIPYIGDNKQINQFDNDSLAFFYSGNEHADCSEYFFVFFFEVTAVIDIFSGHGKYSNK